MTTVGVATPSPLRGRLERILGDEAGVDVVDLASAAAVDVAACHEAPPATTTAGLVVTLPLDPIAHLTDLLVVSACEAAGATGPGLMAHTRPGAPLPSGQPVTFPPPIGAQWTTSDEGRRVATVSGTLAAIAVEATGSRGTVRLGVVDHHDFLAAIGLAAPVLAAITGEGELAAARRAGLGWAEFFPS